MATYSSLLTSSRHDAWISLQVAGYGPLTSATGASEAFRFCTREISGATDASISTTSTIPCLIGLPSAITERANLQDGSTDLSSLGIDLRSDAALPDGQRVSALFHVPQRSEGWRLAADCTAAAATITVDPVGGAYPVVGQALFLGAETLVVTGVGAAPVIDVARGMYGSAAAAHSASGGNAAYSSPQYLRGRRVWLRLDFFDPAGDGTYVRPSSEEAVLWTGMIDEWEIRDRGAVTLSCRPALARLDRAVGRQQWEGSAYGFERLGGPRALLVPLRCSVDVSPEVDQIVPGGAAIESVDPARPGWYRDFYARLGRQLVQARYWTSAEADIAPSSVEILALGCMGTDASELEDGWTADTTLEIREVLPTSPTAREQYLDGSDPLCPFTLSGDTAATSHPIDLMLCLLTSTGAGTNGDWDVLPERWGLGIAQADLDLASFRALKEDTANLSFPNLIIGWDGKPERLRQYLTTEILGPMGWYLRVTTAGLFAIGQISDVYPDDTVTVLTQGEMIPGSFSMRGGLPDTVSLQTWSYGWSWSSESFTRIRKYISEAVRERLIDDDSEIAVECKGIDGGTAAGASAIAHRSLQFSWWWSSPLPRVSLAVRLQRYADLAIGSIVDVSALDLPVFDEASIYGLIVSRGIDLSGLKLDLECYLIPAINTALWAPASTVAAWDAGTHELTIEADDYTDSGDAAWFAGGTPCWLALWDSHGAALCDVPAELVSVAGNVLTLAADFTLGGVDVVPVAGDVATFCRVDSSSAPEGPWETWMQDYAAQADSATGELPDGAAAVVYGG